MTPFQTRQLALMRQMEQTLASDAAAATIVAFQADYATDNQLCLSLNAFVPHEITQSIQSKLIDPLRLLDPSQYYYPEGSLHITFHSIRVVHNPPTYTTADIEMSKQLLGTIIPSQRPFPFTLHGVLSMPTSASVIALITPEYNRFIQNLRRAFVRAGIPDDKKYFTDETVFANCTFCRYTHTPTKAFLEKLQELKDTYVGEFLASNVSLVETNAGAYPSRTTIFETYRFKEI